MPNRRGRTFKNSARGSSCLMDSTGTFYCLQGGCRAFLLMDTKASGGMFTCSARLACAHKRRTRVLFRFQRGNVAPEHERGKPNQRNTDFAFPCRNRKYVVSAVDHPGRIPG